MSWKASLDAAQQRQLRQAVACCSKIGSELLLEAAPGKLVLRSLNAARSAFAAFTFHSDFFDSYAVFDSAVVRGSILIKHALVIFRTQRIRRLVLQLRLRPDEQLSATLTSETGLEKVYRIPCTEAVILQATADRDALPTTVVASAKELSKLLSSFQRDLEEITVIALPEDMHNGQTSNAVQLHSYVDASKKHVDASLHTQISVNTGAVFVSYQHTADAPADVTFNLRDFRVMLSWCATAEADLAIRFKEPGAPLLVEPNYQDRGVAVEAQLVLATLLESQAHRAAARAPATAGPTGMRSTLRTPGSGASPAEIGAPSLVGKGEAPGALAAGVSRGPLHNIAVAPPRRSRFAPQPQRQPDFGTPARPGEMAPRLRRGPDEATAQPASQPITHSQAERLAGTGLLDDDDKEERWGAGGSPAAANGGSPGLGQLPNGSTAPAPESFEDDDREDPGAAHLLRSRYYRRPEILLNETVDSDGWPSLPESPERSDVGTIFG